MRTRISLSVHWASAGCHTLVYGARRRLWEVILPELLKTRNRCGVTVPFILTGICPEQCKRVILG